jgi:amino acid transporter
MLVASVFFMVSATIPAAISTLLIVQNLNLGLPETVLEDTRWVAVIAALWLVLITALVCKGIKAASYTQAT